MNEFIAMLLFYGVTVLFGLMGLPVALRVFSSTTLAYATAKLIGLLGFGYAVWLLASLRILDYQSVWVFVLFGMFVVASCVVLKRSYWGNVSTKKVSGLSGKTIFGIELAGLLVYLGYLYLRAYNADINGTERFMDMALLSASGKAHFFPFIDPWYAGKLVNYYYYGAYIMSVVSKLAHVPYALSYNFALGFVYSQAVLLAFTLIYAIGKSRLIALLGAIVLTSGGTLFFANCQWQSFLSRTPSCSYASSTRLFTPSYIINEIPSYSFTVGDLHAHLLALPMFLLGLALLYVLWQSERPKLYLLGVLVVLFVSLGLTNPWDLVTLSCLGILVLGWKIIMAMRAGDSLLVRAWAKALVATGFVTFVCMWPGLRNFETPVLGLGFVSKFVSVHNLVNVQWPTPLTAELGMWGVLVVSLVFVFASHARRANPDKGYLFWLFVLSLGIIAGVELFFVRDIYSVANPSYFRANTTFKFGYHAWSMLCIAGFAGLGMVFVQARKLTKVIAISLGVITLIGGLVYPVVAVRQFYLSRGVEGRTLDGSSWMKGDSPEDLATVNYINSHFKERAVIAEAVGDSYTTFSRIVTFTGQITPMGWQTHEWTWRFRLEHPVTPGGTQETGWGRVSRVAGDMKTLYETPDMDVARQIIGRYGIQYVYVGGLERKTYSGINEAKFKNLGSVVFSLGNSYLYKINGK